METDLFPANLYWILNNYSVITRDIIKSFDCISLYGKYVTPGAGPFLAPGA